MERTHKLALIQRSLAIKHKLKVHESMSLPETHEDLSLMLMAKWDLEDELDAIEKILRAARDVEVGDHRKLIEKDILKFVKKQDAKRKAFAKRP